MHDTPSAALASSGHSATALRLRATGLTSVGAEKALRNGAREDFLDVFASVAGAVKQLFPRDPTTQDLFFDNLRAPRWTRRRMETSRPEDVSAG